MSTLLSAISGQFSRSVVLGNFFPVTVFVILGIVVIGPWLPSSWPFLNLLASLDPQWKVVVVSLLTIVLTGLLSNLNGPIIRLYEGYPWRDTWIGRRQRELYQRQWKDVTIRRKGLRTLRSAATDDDVLSRLGDVQERINLKATNDFPNEGGLVLPTRMGNAIRCFEVYPYTQYSMDAIILWPRLLGVVGADFAAQVDSAEATFTFMLNSSLLSSLIAFILLVVGFFRVSLLISPRCILWFGEICVFSALAYGLHIGAIRSVGDWGETVKGAFDLYRWQLLKQLGYDRVPATLAEERPLWDDISLQIKYGDTPRVRLADYTTPPTVARGKPYEVDLTVLRQVAQAPQPNTPIEITIIVRNRGEITCRVEDIAVEDTIPEGSIYLSGTASCGDANVSLVGPGRYRFRIGGLAHGTDGILTYRLVPLKGG